MALTLSNYGTGRFGQTDQDLSPAKTALPITHTKLPRSTDLPAITKKQSDLIRFLYHYRFLNRSHLQILAGHKHRNRIISWMNDLQDKSYVHSSYSGAFDKRTTPTVYWLGLNGIRHINRLSPAPLPYHNLYRESARTDDFRDRCLLIADCAIELHQAANDQTKYHLATRAIRNQPGSPLSDLSLSQADPDLVIFKDTVSQTSAYVLTIFQPTSPKRHIRKTIQNFQSAEWLEAWTAVTRIEPPTVLMALSTTSSLIDCKRYLRALARSGENTSDYLLTTTDKLRTEGILGQTWEQA